MIIHPPGEGGLDAYVPSSGWRSAAACRGLDPDLFHGTIAEQRRAARLCRSCPVAEACLWAAMLEEHGLPDRYRFGVRGGLLACTRSRLAGLLGYDELAARYLEALTPTAGPGLAA
jgi:Transcription factor WhiB